MQWLIDMVIEAIGVPPCYIDRGDPANFDWDKFFFTQDGNYYDLDTSAIVPAGAQAIHFRARVRHLNINETFSLREKGNANITNISRIRTQIANVQIDQEFLVKCDSDRIVQYNATPPGWTTLDLAVRGWIL